jgi:hypothetical protein
MFRIVFWDVLPCKIIVNRRFRGASQKTILNIIVDVKWSNKCSKFAVACIEGYRNYNV